MLVCENIVKRYGAHTALKGVSMEVPAGEIFGLLGPNGAGKTTLIRIITRITGPDEGRVLLDVRVSAEGLALFVKVKESSGHDVLDEAAVNAVAHWRFAPARRGGEAVEGTASVPVQFRLNGTELE